MYNGSTISYFHHMLFEDIQNHIKDAMRAKDAVRLMTLRSILSAMKNELVSGVKKETLTDEESLKIIKKLAKQRKDSIEQYTNGNRPDLAEKEAAELHIIESYLPAELSDVELRAITDKVIAELGNSKSSMGILMKAILVQTAGKADGGRVKMLLETLLIS